MPVREAQIVSGKLSAKCAFFMRQQLALIMRRANQLSIVCGNEWDRCKSFSRRLPQYLERKMASSGSQM
jgi:hypothetical protein